MKNKKTKLDKLRERIIRLHKKLLNDAREDVETGIEDGLYENDSQNKAWLKKLRNADVDIRTFAFKDYALPELYILVKGGMIQGISANMDCNIHIYDADFRERDPDDEKENGTPEEWDAKIDKLTAEGEIKLVY